MGGRLFSCRLWVFSFAVNLGEILKIKLFVDICILTIICYKVSEIGVKRFNLYLNGWLLKNNVKKGDYEEVEQV